MEKIPKRLGKRASFSLIKLWTREELLGFFNSHTFLPFAKVVHNVGPSTPMSESLSPGSSEDPNRAPTAHHT